MTTENGGQRNPNETTQPVGKPGRAAKKAAVPAAGRRAQPDEPGTSPTSSTGVIKEPPVALSEQELRTRLEPLYGIESARFYSRFLTIPRTSRGLDVIAIQEELLKKESALDETALSQLRQISDEAQTRLVNEPNRMHLRDFFNTDTPEEDSSRVDHLRSLGHGLILYEDLQYGETENPRIEVVAAAEPPHYFLPRNDLIDFPLDIKDFWEELDLESERLPFFSTTPLRLFNTQADILAFSSHVHNLGPILTGIPLFPEDEVLVDDIQNRARQMISSEPLLTAIVNVYLKQELDIRSAITPAHPPVEQITQPAEPEEAGIGDLRIAIQSDAAVGMGMADLIAKYGRDESQITLLLEPHSEDFRLGEGQTQHKWTETERAALVRAIAIDSTPTDLRPALSFNELAEKYGLGRSTLAKLRKEAGVGNTHGPQVTPEERQGIIEDATGGMAIKQLVRKYSKARSTVSLILSSAGLTQERGQSQTVLQLWQDGQQQLSYTELKKRALQAGLKPEQFWAAVRYLTSETGGNYPIPRAGDQPTEE